MHPTRPLSLPVVLLSAVLFTLTGRTASPTLRVLWTTYVEKSDSIIWAGKDMVLVSSQASENGGYLNTVQAVNNTGSQWTFASFGEVSVITTAVSFPSIPKLVFLLQNNLQPPNVTAVLPSTGRVVWSSAAAFPTGTVPQLSASFDGRTLYLFTTDLNGRPQLTTFDVNTGDTLFTKATLHENVNVTRCGAARVACVAEILDHAVFWDGRTGALLKNLSIPFSVGYGSTSYATISEDLMLLVNAPSLVVMNTTSYTIAWQVIPWAVSQIVADAHEYMSANVKRLAVVAISTSGLAGFDAATGETLWNVTAQSICPFSPPAPDAAEYFSNFQLGAFPPGIGGGDLFSFTATCYYYPNTYLNILGAVAAANGDLHWWRYLSQYPTATYPLLPVGRKTFMVYSAANTNEDLYYGSDANSFVSSPWGQLYDFCYAAAADGIAYTQYGQNDESQCHLAAITVVES